MTWLLPASASAINSSCQHELARTASSEDHAGNDHAKFDFDKPCQLYMQQAPRLVTTISYLGYVY